MTFHSREIRDIPRELWTNLAGGLVGGMLDIVFWKDNSDDLFMFLSSDQVKALEEYGVSNELIEWMRRNDMYRIDSVQIMDTDDFADTETFTITDEVVIDFIDSGETGMTWFQTHFLSGLRGPVEDD